MRFNMIIASVLFVVSIAISSFAIRANNRLKQIEESLLPPIEQLELQEDETPDQALVRRASEILAESDKAVDLAFSLLGLFEALTLAVTVGGVVLTSFGLTRFNTAQRELTETRERIVRDLEDYRSSFEEEVRQREQVLRKLRDDLEEAARSERQTTQKALLANALIPLGERQYRATDYKGALNTYNRALELDPTNPVVNQRLAYVYTQSGELDKASEHYQRAIDAEPDFAPALAGLGFVSRRFAEKLDTAIEKSTASEEELLQRRIERDQMLNKAEELLLHALKISPKLVDDDGESWWGVLGGLYKRRGQIDQAIAAYREATIVTPQSSYGFGNLALLYMKQHKRKEMLETYERVEQIASKEADAEQGNFWGYADLIVSSYAIGKVDQAREALPVAIAIAPSDSPYMLDGLVETLRELTTVLEKDDLPAINEAIQIIDSEMARRAEEVEKLEG